MGNRRQRQRSCRTGDIWRRGRSSLHRYRRHRHWLWKALSVLSPRVVVTEINHLWGPEDAVTVPYADDFKAVFTQYGSDYAGASIAAFNKLAQTKGYRLVGANAFATNVFFVRNDLLHPWLPEVSPKSLFWHPRAAFGQNVRFQGIKDMAWERV